MEKYKVGDLVKIKNFTAKTYRGWFGWNPKMDKFCGTTMKIVAISGYYPSEYYLASPNKEDNTEISHGNSLFSEYVTKWVWSDEMFDISYDREFMDFLRGISNAF